LNFSDPFHLKIARIALAVAGHHGFALGGGLALAAHGVIDRPTIDVDLFTDQDGGVPAAADLVQSALDDAGIRWAIEQYLIDVGAFLGDRTPQQLLAMARQVDPGIEDAHIARAGRRLDETPDRELARYGLDDAAIADLRRRFAPWPR
jgi:hypothetical protein